MSIVDEAARIKVARHAARENELVEQLLVDAAATGGARPTWMRVLSHVAAPRTFTLHTHGAWCTIGCNGCVDHPSDVLCRRDHFAQVSLQDDGREFRVCAPNGTCPPAAPQYTSASVQAVCGRPMRGGVHHAEFAVEKCGGVIFELGIIDERAFALPPDPDGGGSEELLTELNGRLEEMPTPVGGQVRSIPNWVASHPGCWGWESLQGDLLTSNDGRKCEGECGEWREGEKEGYCDFHSIGVQRDTVGLRLDLDSGTLAAYKGGERLGVLLDGLSGKSFCW